MGIKNIIGELQVNGKEVITEGLELVIDGGTIDINVEINSFGTTLNIDNENEILTIENNAKGDIAVIA